MLLTAPPVDTAVAVAPVPDNDQAPRVKLAVASGTETSMYMSVAVYTAFKVTFGVDRASGDAWAQAANVLTRKKQHEIKKSPECVSRDDQE